MKQKEITDKINQILNRHKSRLEKAATTDKPWDNFLTNAPSLVVKLKLAETFAFHEGQKSDTHQADKEFLEGLMDKNDWEYMRYYSADKRYQDWVTKMQQSAPDSHPEGVE